MGNRAKIFESLNIYQPFLTFYLKVGFLTSRKQVPGLANGEIHVLDGRTTWGARVKYVCKEDYSLMKGGESRVCEAGGWGGDAPECILGKCPAPEGVANAAIERHIGDKRNFLGSKMVYECEEGHMPSGSLSRDDGFISRVCLI